MGRSQVALVCLLLLAALLVQALVACLLVPPSRSFVRGDNFAALTITDRNGAVLREVGASPNGVSHWVPLEQVDTWLVLALVSAEDRRFYRHLGIDPFALGRALLSNLRERRVIAGGSTITQQLVRNLYLSPRRTLPVKLAEAVEALRLEMHLTKREILEAYLNRIPFGNHTFGVAAAARLYFNRSCSDLSLAQSCYLAALVRAPGFYDPLRRPANARRRQRWILDELLSLERISRLDYQAALAESIVVCRDCSRFRAPHFVDRVLAGLGRQEPGLTGLRTTLDWPLQQRCEQLLSNQLSQLVPNHATNGAVVVLDRVRGDILAMVGSADYFEPDAGQVNACLSLRQPGSAVKPFVYACAFERGLAPADILPDVPQFFAEPAGDYCPVNYDREFHGPVSARTALGCSYNVPAVYVAQDLGPELLLQRLRQAGIMSLGRTSDYYGLALCLGAGDLTLLELTNAYRMLANGGEYGPVHDVISGRSINGQCLTRPDSAPRRVFSPEACYLVTDILRDNNARSPAFGEFSCLSLPFACAVKTGTSKDYRDNWTIGYTQDYVVGVWVGNFDGSPMQRVSGIAGAGPLFRDLMLTLHRNDPPEFISPEGIVRVQVCPKSGRRPGPYCPTSVVELFIRDSEPTDICGVHQALLSEGSKWEDSSNLEVGRRRPHRSSESVFAERRPSVVFPDDGDVFKVDPDLSAESQALLLRASVPTDPDDAAWIVDNREVARVGPPYIHIWKLEPGKHRVRIESGREASPEVSFLVLP